MKANIATMQANIANVLVNAADARIKSDNAGAVLALAIAELYAVTSVSQSSFFNVFGNGEPPKSKEYKAGTLAETVRERIARLGEEKQKKALDVLKTRLSEARRAFKAGLILGDNETVQQAIARHNKNTASASTPNTAPKADDSTSNVRIAPSATMDEIADALSIWIASHGSAASSLAKKLGDFLPITVTNKTRKTA